MMLASIQGDDGLMGDDSPQSIYVISSRCGKTTYEK